MHCASVPLKERHMQAFLWHVVAYGIVQRMFNVKSQVSHIGLQVFSLRTIRKVFVAWGGDVPGTKSENTLF